MSEKFENNTADGAAAIPPEEQVKDTPLVEKYHVGQDGTVITEKERREIQQEDWREQN